MKVNDVAKLTGVTIRTLHYYDQIGLLKPNEKVEDTGYRLYNDKNLETLQQILLFRELDFPLTEIKRIISQPNYNKREALMKQKQLLQQKENHIKGLIQLIDGMLNEKNNRSFKEFDMSEFENAKQEYIEEAKERWGNTDAYKESERKTKSYTKEKWSEINEEYSNILLAFSKIRTCDPASVEAQTLVQQWQAFITDKYYTCTKEILRGLGMMYVQDERFKKNMDCYGEGTAEFISRAIEIYCRE